jgi:hypothetical protein
MSGRARHFDRIPRQGLREIASYLGDDRQLAREYGDKKRMLDDRQNRIDTNFARMNEKYEKAGEVETILEEHGPTGFTRERAAALFPDREVPQHLWSDHPSHPYQNAYAVSEHFYDQSRAARDEAIKLSTRFNKQKVYDELDQLKAELDKRLDQKVVEKQLGIR